MSQSLATTEVSSIADNNIDKKLKIFFYTIDCVGHINACIGLAQSFHQRGHQIYFLDTKNFSGLFEKYGFNEILLDIDINIDKNDEKNVRKIIDENNHPIKDVKINNMVVESDLLSGKSSYEQLDAFDRNKNKEICEAMYQDVKNVHEQLRMIINDQRPDLIIVDFALVPPCIAYGKIPWATLWSANPIPIFRSNDLPPFTSGYPTNDRKDWKKFQDKFDQTIEPSIQYYQNLLNKEFGGPTINFEEFFIISPHIVIYGYPKELDYSDIVQLPENFIRVDAFCRQTIEKFEIPENEFTIEPDDKLIYLSMGSIGSSSIPLMSKIVQTLAKTPYKYIVSKGQYHEQLELPSNMWGRGFLPQTNVIPLVDMVITHGGNNTITETFSFGKPMLVMPLFGDQFDNAQRIQEKGFGYRMSSHHYNDNELIEMIDKILNDSQMIEKCRKASKRMINSNSKQIACQKIEKILQKYGNSIFD